MHVRQSWCTISDQAVQVVGIIWITWELLFMFMSAWLTQLTASCHSFPHRRLQAHKLGSAGAVRSVMHFEGVDMLSQRTVVNSDHLAWDLSGVPQLTSICRWKRLNVGLVHVGNRDSLERLRYDWAEEGGRFIGRNWDCSENSHSA